jgi:hypothetical protein
VEHICFFALFQLPLQRFSEKALFYNIMKKYIFILAIITAALTSCGGAHFKVTGNIKGATDTTSLVLESATDGQWFAVDTIEVGSNGDFSFSEPAPQYPEVYRITHAGQSIYFPIDSIDNLKINTEVKNFATAYTISGSKHAEQMMKIDKRAQQILLLPAAQQDAAIAQWKSQLVNEILADPSGIVAYYIINKYIGNRPLYDAVDDNDLKIIGAVANAYNTFKPNDPRTAYLVKVLLQGQQRRRAAMDKNDTMMVSETKIIDIKLQDKNGVDQDLQQVTSKGDVILLNFTAYTAKFSPVFNKVLADVFRKHHAAGFNIFQIGYDDDEFQWRQSAANMPWITVFDPNGTDSNVLRTYNVTVLPTTFIINRSGEIVERVTDITKLDAEVAKYM